MTFSTTRRAPIRCLIGLLLLHGATHKKWEDNMNRAIRNSAKALIIKEGKVLAIKIREQDEEWYIMPGGGQESEELLTDAVCREVAEETGVEVAAKELVFVFYPSKLRRQIMNLYEGKPYTVYLGNEEVGDLECFE